MSVWESVTRARSVLRSEWTTDGASSTTGAASTLGIMKRIHASSSVAVVEKLLWLCKARAFWRVAPIDETADTDMLRRWLPEGESALMRGSVSTSMPIITASR